MSATFVLQNNIEEAQNIKNKQTKQPTNQTSKNKAKQT